MLSDLKNTVCGFIEKNPYVLLGITVLLIVVILYFIFSGETKKPKETVKSKDKKSSSEVSKLIDQLHEKQD